MSRSELLARLARLWRSASRPEPVRVCPTLAEMAGWAPPEDDPPVFVSLETLRRCRP